MVIFTWPVLAPLLLATGTYYLFGLFLSDVNAFGAATIAGSMLSVLMEFAGMRATLFFIPVGAWMGALALNHAFELTALNPWEFEGQASTAFMVMAVITAILGVLSILGLFVPAEALEEGTA